MFTGLCHSSQPYHAIKCQVYLIVALIRVIYTIIQLNTGYSHWLCQVPHPNALRNPISLCIIQPFAIVFKFEKKVTIEQLHVIRKALWIVVMSRHLFCRVRVRTYM